MAASGSCRYGDEVGKEPTAEPTQTLGVDVEEGTIPRLHARETMGSTMENKLE
jgi:hypothetical protein